MLDRNRHYADAVAALEAEVADWRARIEETLPVIAVLKARLAPQTPPERAPKQKRPTKAAPKKSAPAKPAKAAAPTDVEARRERARISMRRRRAALKQQAIAAAPSIEPPASEPPPPGWYRDEHGNLCREHIAVPVSPTMAPVTKVYAKKPKKPNAQAVI
jgi:hypothetical protein